MSIRKQARISETGIGCCFSRGACVKNAHNACPGPNFGRGSLEIAIVAKKKMEIHAAIALRGSVLLE